MNCEHSCKSNCYSHEEHKFFEYCSEGKLHKLREMEDNNQQVYNYNVVNKNGHSGMQLAARGGHIRVVEYLELKNLNVLLTTAAANGQLEAVKYFISRGADFNNNPKYRGPPLWWAAKGGHLETVKHLVSLGADTSGTSGTVGETPLVQAVREHHTEIVKVLAGITPYPLHNDKHRSALYRAAEYGTAEIVKVLLIVDPNKRVLHDTWYRCTDIEITKVLIDFGCLCFNITTETRLDPKDQMIVNNWQGQCSEYITTLSKVLKFKHIGPEVLYYLCSSMHHQKSDAEILSLIC